MGNKRFLFSCGATVPPPLRPLRVKVMRLRCAGLWLPIPLGRNGDSSKYCMRAVADATAAVAVPMLLLLYPAFHAISFLPVGGHSSLGDGGTNANRLRLARQCCLHLKPTYLETLLDKLMKNKPFASKTGVVCFEPIVCCCAKQNHSATTPR